MARSSGDSSYHTDNPWKDEVLARLAMPYLLRVVPMPRPWVASGSVPLDPDAAHTLSRIIEDGGGHVRSLYWSFPDPAITTAPEQSLLVIFDVIPAEMATLQEDMFVTADARLIAGQIREAVDGSGVMLVTAIEELRRPEHVFEASDVTWIGGEGADSGTSLRGHEFTSSDDEGR